MVVSCNVVQPLHIQLHRPIQISNLCTKQPKHTYSVQKYISNNKISPFILFTLINNCCKCIMIYHNIMNQYHGNTSLHNFYMYENHECVLLETTSEDPHKTLTKSRKYRDYDIFFSTCLKELMYKNNHFIKMFNNYRTCIISYLFS